MQKIFIDGVAPGAIIAEDVYGMDGVLLVKQGTTFREQYITRFKEAGVREVFINSNGSMSSESVKKVRKSLSIQDVIHEKTRVHAQAQIKKTMMRFRSVSNGDIYKIGKIIEEMIEQLLEKRDFVFALSQLRSVDDYTYEHSVNVGVLSMVIGIELGLDKQALRNLGLGAMLHDIGKIMVPENILKKTVKINA